MGLLSGVDTTWVLGAAVLILVLYLIFGEHRIRRNGVPLRRPPNTLPLAGNGLVFLQDRQKLFSWFVKVAHKFGYETVQISVPSLPPGVIINDPRNLEHVFKNEGLFGKGAFVKQRSWDLFGNGIINADGELWKAQRKAGLSFLNTSNLRVLTDVALPVHVARGVDFVRTSDKTAPVDLQAVFHDITTRLMGRMAYNMDMHSGDDFAVAFDYASGATAVRFQNPLWRLTDVFFGARLRRAVATIREFGGEIVASAVRDREREALLKEQREGVSGGGEVPAGEKSNSKLDEISGSLIRSLLDSIGDHRIVADAALNYLSAGRDTTAQALTWTFYLLLKNGFVLGEIRNEVKDVLEGSSSSPESKQQLDTTFFTPTSMPYTLAVFYEALRLFPPIPFEIKQCLRETTLPDGTFLPRDSIVLWCPWAMNRSRITWGDDADVFRPERWLVAGGRDDSSSRKVMNRSAAEFPVFNGGPRLCLGKKMAELIAVQVIAAFAWEFDFVPAYDGERVSKNSLTLPMKDGLPCFAKPRKLAR